MNSIGWFEIYVDDIARARAFYEAVFNVTLEKMPNPKPDSMPDLEMWMFPGNAESYGAMGAIAHMPGVKAGVGGTLIYFNCEDCAQEQARVAEAGGQVHQNKFSIGEFGYIAIVSDSEGNMLGLHSQT